MDRSLVEDRLAWAEQRITSGDRSLARQRSVVDALIQSRHDTTRATDLLRVFERTQAQCLAERDRLRSELMKGTDRFA